MLFFVVSAILMINLVVGVIMISMMEAKAEQMNGAVTGEWLVGARGEYNKYLAHLMGVRIRSRGKA